MARIRIGLEVHAQLLVKSKLFSPHIGKVNPLDIAVPGVLPKLNMECVEKGIAAALLLDCQVNKWSRFDRKHYFYPDLPLGYQITQYYHPLARDGLFEGISIDRLQLEQDTAKRDGTRWDFKRAGMALVEIVTKPEISSGEEASHLCWSLSKLLKDYNVSSGCLEDGSMRVDLNVSLHDEASDKLVSPRCEIKNVNGFKFINKAIDLMSELQMQKVKDPPKLGEQVTTWAFDQATGSLKYLRDKTSSADYQYFPDPELPPLIIPQELIQIVKLELSNTTIMNDPKIINLFEKYPQAKEIYSQVDHAKLDWLCSNYFGKYEIPNAKLLDILRKIGEGSISFHYAKQLFTNSDDFDQIEDLHIAEFDSLISENASLIERYKASKNDRFLGPLIGVLLKRNPKCDPKKLKLQLIERIE